MKRVRIECADGVSYRAKIYDPDTGEELKNVYKAEILLDVRKPVACILYMHNVEVDVVATRVTEETTPVEIRTPYEEIKQLQDRQDVSRAAYEHFLHERSTRDLTREEYKLFEKLKAVWQGEPS